MPTSLSATQLRYHATFAAKLDYTWRNPSWGGGPPSVEWEPSADINSTPYIIPGTFGKYVLTLSAQGTSIKIWYVGSCDMEPEVRDAWTVEGSIHGLVLNSEGANLASFAIATKSEQSLPCITIFNLSFDHVVAHSVLWSGPLDPDYRLLRLHGDLVITRNVLRCRITNYKTGVVVILDRDVSVLLAAGRTSSVSGVVEFCHGYILVAQLWGVDIFECPEPLMSTHAPEKDSSNDPTPIAARLLATMSRSVHSWWLAVSFHPYCTGSSHLDCKPESAEPCQISILIRTRYPDAPRTASIPGNQIIHHLLTLSPELLSYARRFPAPKGPIAHIGAEAHENGYVRITEVQTRVLNGPHSSRKIIMSSTSGRGFWLENVQMRHDSPSVENIVLFSTSSVDGGVSLPDGEEEVPQLPTNAGSTLHPLVDIGGVDTSTVSLKWQHFKPFDLLPKHRSRGEELPTAQQPQGTVRYVDKLPLRGVSMCSFDDSSGRIAMKMVGGKVRVVDFGAVSSQEHA